METLENCETNFNPDQVLTVLNSSISIKKDCALSSTSCIRIKPYETFKAKIKMTGSDNRDQGTSSLDLCAGNDVPDLMKFHLAVFGIPIKCSMKEEQDYCFNGTKLFSLSGITQRVVMIMTKFQYVNIKITTEHDSGTSCLYAKLKITT